MQKILFVSTDPEQLAMEKKAYEEFGYEPIMGVLGTRGRDKYPDAIELLEKCSAEHVHLAAVVVHDDSYPRDDRYLKQLGEGYVHAGEKLETVEQDVKESLGQMGFSVSGSPDPMRHSHNLKRLHDVVEKTTKDLIEMRRAELIAGRNAAENLIGRHPPTDKGVQFLRALRAENSAYRSIIAVVEGAHFDRREVLKEAGASLVSATDEPPNLGVIALMRALGVSAPGPANHRERARRQALGWNEGR